MNARLRMYKYCYSNEGAIYAKGLWAMSYMYTAVSTKVVPQKRKSVRDNADWYYG